MSDRIGPYKPYDGPYPGDRMRTADGRTGVVRALGLNGQILLQTDDGEVLPWLPGGELEPAPWQSADFLGDQRPDVFGP